jgi:uncharacterized membrane protein YuzA (DUF378 family)
VFLLLVAIQVIMKTKHPVRHAIGGILVGLCTLAAVDLASAFTGVSLPISPLTIGVAGVAGIPGVTLLLLTNLILK